MVISSLVPGMADALGHSSGSIAPPWAQANGGYVPPLPGGLWAIGIPHIKAVNRYSSFRMHDVLPVVNV